MLLEISQYYYKQETSSYALIQCAWNYCLFFLERRRFNENPINFYFEYYPR